MSNSNMERNNKGQFVKGMRSWNKGGVTLQRKLVCLDDTPFVRYKMKKDIYCLIDESEWERMSAWSWKLGTRKYVQNSSCGFLYRFIMDYPKGKTVDHINGDKLDNRKSNLRICNYSDNACNRGKQSNNKSGYKGVWWERDRGKWTSRIGYKRTYIRLGYFDNALEAASAYNDKATELHGEFAKLNKLP